MGPRLPRRDQAVKTANGDTRLPFDAERKAMSALLQVGIIALPFTRAIFKATSHTQLQWVILLVLALTPVTVVELY